MVTAVDMERMVRQMARPAPSLATVLTRWIRHRRLTQVQIARASGITRSYISALAHGRVARPSAETLRRLARGLATDPETDQLDQLLYEQILRELAAAVGFDDLTREPDRGALVREIQAAGSNLQAADFWRALIEEHPNPPPSLQQMLKMLADMHDRPGGGDLRGLWLLLAATVPPDIEALLLALRHGRKPQSS